MDSLMGQIHSLFEAAEEATDQDVSSAMSMASIELQDDCND